MRVFIKNNWQILLLNFFVVFVFTIFYGKFGDIVVDSFREIYICKQILIGQSLYKDIFAIYPPLGYFINAFLMKIFVTETVTVYFASLLTTLGIITISYNLAKYFLNSKFAFAICLFTISGLVLSTNVFNTFLPYSCGLLYGILFILLTAFFAIKEKFPWMYFFYSLAILSKYEFLLLLPLLLFVSKNQDLKKNIIAFITPIFFVLMILILQGVRLVDLFAIANLINVMSSTKTLYWFYSVMGLVYRVELVPIYLINLLIFITPIFIFKIFSFLQNYIKCKQIYMDVISFILSVIILLFLMKRFNEIMIYIFPLILLLFIFRFKRMKKNEIIFVLLTLLISIKVFFALSLNSYGAYFLPFALISLGVLVPKYFKKELCITILIWAILIGWINCQGLLNKNSTAGIIPVIEYIKTNTKNEDKVVVYPECLSINVLADRESDNKFYSLIPLYVETFGEDLVIKRLEHVKPKYIILNNYDTSLYYYKEFGVDYAQKIVEWISKNYNLKTVITTNLIYKFYELKD